MLVRMLVIVLVSTKKKLCRNLIELLALAPDFCTCPSGWTGASCERGND